MSIFSGLAGALPWDLYRQPEYFYLFREVKDFLELLDVDFENQGFHPGVYKFDNGTYQYKKDYVKRMIGKKNDEKTDMVYLRSADRNFAIGAINNRTISWANYFGCQPVDQVEIPPVQPENVSTSQQNLKLKNMRTLRYYLDYYSPTNLGNPSSSDNLGPNVKIETTLNLNDDYIRLFRARHQSVSWSPIQSDSQTSTLDTELPLLIWEIEDSENETNNELVEIELFPNPVEEFLYIESSILLGNTKLQVMDLTGKLIFETKLNSAFDQEVDLTNLNTGIYLVRLIQNGLELEIKKIRKL